MRSSEIDLFNLFICQFTPMTGLEVSEHNWPDRNPNKPQRRVPYCGGHATDLSVQPLAERDFQPGSRHVFAEADGHGSIG